MGKYTGGTAVLVTLTEEQLAMLDDFADPMGIGRATAARIAMVEYFRSREYPPKATGGAVNSFDYSPAIPPPESEPPKPKAKAKARQTNGKTK